MKSETSINLQISKLDQKLIKYLLDLKILVGFFIIFGNLMRSFLMIFQWERLFSWVC